MQCARAFDYIAESLTAKIYSGGDGILSRVRINGSILPINPFLRVRSLVRSRIRRSIGGDLQPARTVIMRRRRRTVGAGRLTSFFCKRHRRRDDYCTLKSRS